MNKYLRFHKDRFGMAGGTEPGWDSDEADFGNTDDKKMRDAGFGILIGIGFLFALPFIMMTSEKTGT